MTFWICITDIARPCDSSDCVNALCLGSSPAYLPLRWSMVGGMLPVVGKLRLEPVMERGD